MQGDACIILTTTKHLLRRAVNGAAGKACRPMTAMTADAIKFHYKNQALPYVCSEKLVLMLKFHDFCHA